MSNTPCAKGSYVAQILDALDAAHRKGTTHHDLKPLYILATRRGVKLDFGLAKLTHARLRERDSDRKSVV